MKAALDAALLLSDTECSHRTCIRDLEKLITELLYLNISLK